MGDHEEATRLIGATDPDASSRREGSGGPAPEEVNAVAELARRALGEAAYDRYATMGRSMTDPQMLALLAERGWRRSALGRVAPPAGGSAISH
jgi:hypothetical protein